MLTPVSALNISSGTEDPDKDPIWQAGRGSDRRESARLSARRMDSTYLEWHEPPRGIRGLSSLRRTARSAASEYVVWTGPAGGAAIAGTVNLRMADRSTLLDTVACALRSATR
jgi:hypothetical protein